MTEAEWLAATEPGPLLWWLRDKVSQRKAWLFSYVCLGGVQHLLTDPRSRSAVEVLADLVEGRATQNDFYVAHAGALAALNESLDAASKERGQYAKRSAFGAVSICFDSVPTRLQTLSVDCGYALRMAGNSSDEPEILKVEDARQLSLLRCIFGNPFRPVAFAPSWRTETAVALATGIYADRAFDRLPILADALEEAGCDHPDVLSHLRGPGPHARGCWVIDAVLNKV